MRMIDGGSTVPRVPALQTTPQARLLRYFAASIAGSASKPSVSTEAPTAPVVGASSAPRITVEIDRPPARDPNKLLIASSNSAASVVRCMMTPR